MNDTIYLILNDMISYYKHDPKRIQHFLKVHSFAALIAANEIVPPETKNIIEIAAVVHDIGIKNSEDQYGSASGHYQQIEGPPVARELLQKHQIESEIIERICFLIAHHHTYTHIDSIDHQILVEADFLVNIYEDQMDQSQIRSVLKNIFKTPSGIHFLNELYL